MRTTHKNHPISRKSPFTIFFFLCAEWKKPLKNVTLISKRPAPKTCCVFAISPGGGDFGACSISGKRFKSWTNSLHFSVAGNVFVRLKFKFKNPNFLAITLRELVCKQVSQSHLTVGPVTSCCVQKSSKIHCKQLQRTCFCTLRNLTWTMPTRLIGRELQDVNKLQSLWLVRSLSTLCTPWCIKTWKQADRTHTQLCQVLTGYNKLKTFPSKSFENFQVVTSLV